MQRLTTASEMQSIDRRAIEEAGIAGATLMENAGRSVADVVERELGGLAGRRVLVLCGPGNNGGDGFVIARLLAGRGAAADCVLLAPLAGVRGDARSAADRLLEAGLPIREVKAADELAPLLAGHDAVVDAVFGTGLTAAPRALAGDAIRLVNDSGARVFAVDVPSGVDSDTGATHDPAVRAQHTVTMGLAKVGLWLYPGRALAGRVHVADIGFPAPLLADGARTYLVGDADVRQRLPPRPPDGHKGTFGTALIVAGSRGFSGAACLSAQAAVRSGVGLVRLAVPRALGDVVSTRTLEPVKLVLPQTYNEVLGFNALDPLLEASAQADAVAVGPGISTDPEVRKLVLELLPGVEKPLVVDADGLNNLVGALGVLDDLKAPAVLTPHPGELGRLLGTSAADINARRVEVARDFAGRHRCILVLKGAATVVAEPQGRVFVNPTGNSGLGSGGTGDVLTGLLTGLIAQGVPPLDAAIVAVFLHGRAADIAAAEVTEYCLCASDLLDYLPRAFRSVLDPASG